MYWLYRFVIEWEKEEKDPKTGERVLKEGKEYIEARDLKEARRQAHELYKQNKWTRFKVDYLTAKAVGKYLRTSVKKMKPIIDLIRGKSYREARNILAFIPRKAARLAEKVLDSAAANAENNHDMNFDRLYIREIYVDRGPYFKRIDTKAFGRATLKKKPTVHLTVKLSERRFVRSKPKDKIEEKAGV